MATKPKTPPAAIESAALKFDPKWVFDPAPPWLRDFIKGDLLRQHMEIQLQAQIEMMKVQTDYLNRSLDLVKKSK